MTTIPADACFDSPSPLDYKAEEMERVGSTEAKPSFPEALLKIFNQGLDSDTIMSCTSQGLANITNGNNLLAQNTQELLLGKRKWLEAVAKSPEIKKAGDYLQNRLYQFKADKLIAGYYIVKGKKEHMEAIDKGHFIYSGSNNGNWADVRDLGVYSLKNPSSGHAFVKGVAYDSYGLRAINSYGDDNGFFFIPWELCDTTYTSYAIVDFVDEASILLYKKQLMEKEIEEAVSLGIFNGQNLDGYASRSEVARMVLRAYKLTKGI